MKQNIHRDTKKLRKIIIKTCIDLFNSRFFLGTWGNLSVRLEEGFIITPSRIEYNQMKRNDLVISSFSGNTIKGRKKPSSEMHLHRKILLKRKELNVLIHIHSLFCTALACMNKEIPVITEEASQIIGGTVKCTDYIPAGKHLKFAEEACNKFGLTSNGLLIANHGAIVGGRTIDEAILTATILEKVAKIYINCLNGDIRCIDEIHIKEERERYLYHYGQ